MTTTMILLVIWSVGALVTSQVVKEAVVSSKYLGLSIFFCLVWPFPMIGWICMDWKQFKKERDEQQQKIKDSLQ